jgi:hypothetical protein
MSTDHQHYFFDWEKDILGHTGIDLKGDPFLKSDIHWLYLYLSQVCPTEDQDIKIQPIDDIPVHIWSHFPIHLYLQHDKSIFSKATLAAQQFLDWLGLKPEFKSMAPIASGALQSTKKDIERLIKLYKHFSERQNTWVYIPGPTESLEDIQWNEELLELQKPDVSESNEDIFQLISKDTDKNRAYFKSIHTQQAMVVQMDQKIIQWMECGDRLPMSLLGAPGQLHFLNHVGYPILPEVL